MALKDLYNKNMTGPFPADGRVENRTYAFPNSSKSYDTSGNVEKPVVKPLFSPTPAPTPEPNKPAFDNSKFINPQTGKVYSDQEYADMMAAKARGGNTSIGGYAGGQITDPNQSVADLTKQGRTLNNAANDLATGTTDPYGVASKSGIQYTPAELKAIEMAYAGVFDPAINDVFTKLETKKKLDEEEAKAKRDLELEKAKMETFKEQKIFSTNENIREWRATTGKTASSSDDFTDTQRNKGAANAGMTITEFNKLDPDIKNFYINSPKKVDPDTNKSVPQYKIFEDAFAQVKAGTMDPDELSQQITDSKTLPEAVKHYFIDQIPLAPEKKQGYFGKLWGAITGQ